MIRIPERSLYRKIQVILDEARKMDHSSTESLVKNILRMGYLNFTYFEVEKSGKAVPRTVKKETVKKVIETCIHLDLLTSGTAELTKVGHRAVERDLFNNTLRNQLKKAFRSMGCPVELIFDKSAAILSNRGEMSVSTWETIFRDLSLDSSNKKRFHEYLNLFALCGGIEYSQKRIFLPGPPPKNSKSGKA